MCEEVAGVSLTALEQLVKAGQFTRAMKVFDALLRDGSLGGNDLALAYHLASICQYRQAEYYSARQFGQRAEEHAKAAGESHLLGRIWVNLITLCMEVGDTPQALEYGELWLSNVDDHFLELKPHEATVHLNLAQTHRVRRNRSAMFQHFRAAVDLSKDGQLPAEIRVHIHQVYAWCLYAAEKIAEGDEQARLAGDLVEDDDIEGKREQLLLQAYRSYQSGDHKTAVQLAEEFIAPGALVTDRQHFWALWISSMIASDSGLLESGLALAHLATEVALRLKHSEYMNAASDARKKAMRLHQLRSDD